MVLFFVGGFVYSRDVSEEMISVLIDGLWSCLCLIEG